MKESTSTLSEFDSKQLLAGYGIPTTREGLAQNADEAVAKATALGFPVVVKLCGARIAHKTERDGIRLGLFDAAGVRQAAEELLALVTEEDGDVSLLVSEMVKGRRELIAGLVRDPQFGPCVMLGLGGILTEALGDVVFAAAPVSERDARRMIRSLGASHLLTQSFRGDPPADEAALAGVLVGLSRLALERPEVASVDLNPVLLAGASPIAVDALVEIVENVENGEIDEGARPPPPAEASADEILERFRPLFHPRGIAVAGVSSHPGKFGFVTLHNLLCFGYEGKLFAIKPDGADVLERSTFKEVAAIPDDQADLVFVCTPNRANVQLLRDCAKKGIRAAFVASAGYAESGEDGVERQRELVAVANELDMLLIGPNGQGVVSTPASMCAQIVPPYPPGGRIGVASQSGNLVSSYLNYAVSTGVGVSKAVSLGNSAQTSLADLLDYFAVDPDTDVALVYVEGIDDGLAFQRAARRLTARKPLVLVKGGVGEAGKRAAASHTGALASDDRVFDGLCRQLGILRAPTIEQAFEWAATLATQPVPRGGRTVVFTSVGGWGVLAADACSAAGLDLVPLPDDIRERIDEMVPARWSRNNPIDLAGGETRDTIPEVMELVCAHPDVDAMVHLGLGIQAAQARAFQSGPFRAAEGIERIASFHERQDARYAEAARDASVRHGKPVLCATELVFADRDNAGVRGVREVGRVCYPSAHRAVDALAALARWAEFSR
jgi:acyl-CoA synthetase (NDP forming)